MYFNKKTLENGIRVITVPMKDNPTVTVLVMAEAGSKYETKDTNGLSHFLEHMCFKGTTARPSAMHISKELDSIGSHYNAFTSQEFTGYYAKAGAEHAEKILDVVADLYLNPTLPEKEIEKEKGVIAEEINMYEDLPHRHVQDLFMELVYGDQPAGWPIIGSREVVQAMSRKDFVEYRSKHYVAEGTIVVVAGNFDEKKMQQTIAKTFSSVAVSPKLRKIDVVEWQEKPMLAVQYKKTDQAHLVLGVRSYRASDPRHEILRVLEGVLGGGMSSRLFQKLREEMGVGYYVRANEDSYTDHGLFTVSAGVDVSRVAEVVRAILGEFNKLKEELVGAEELSKVKEHLNGSTLLHLESSDSIAEYYGMQEILGRPLALPEEAAKKVRVVSDEEVREAARALFVNEGLNLAIVGPFTEEKEFIDVLTL